MAIRTLYFNQIFTSMQKVHPGQTQFEFFKDNDSDEESITSLGEHDVIDWILNDEVLKKHFVSSLVTDSRIYCIAPRVTKPVLEPGQLPGDIDILIWPNGKPELAIAIECKRVKVVVAKSGTENVNRLTQTEKGIKQAGQLRELGFHKSYVAYFILTDGRNKKGVNTLSRHAASDTIQKVFDVPMNEALSPEVGVIYIHFTQPTGTHYKLNYGFGVCIDKNATELEQPKNLTEKIQQLSEVSELERAIKKYQ